MRGMAGRWRTLLRLLGYLRPYGWRVAVAYGAMLAVIGLNLLVPWIVRDVIDRGLARGDRPFLLVAAGLILGIALVRSAFGALQMYLGEWLSFRVAHDLRNALYAHLQRLSFSFYDRAQTGDLMSRVTADVEQTQRFTGMGLMQVINVLLLVSAVVVVLLRVNARLAIVALAPFPLLFFLVIRLARTLRPLAHALQVRLGRLGIVMQESLTGIRVVKAFAREPDELEKFRHQNEAFYHRRVTLVDRWVENFSTMQLLLAGGIGLVLWFGGREVLRGTFTVGTLFAFISYIGQLSQPIRQLGFLISRATDAVASAERLFEILDVSPDVQDPPGGVELPMLRGHVRFEHVSFSYNRNHPVLCDISFEAKPGQVVAIIGPTGSGKSTLTALIPRFYDVTAGRVLVDGYDVRDVRLESLRRQIGIVFQDSFLFSTTVHENIAYGRPDAGREEVIEAAKAAHAHEFIMALPEGYDTRVGERGVTLSGGQRQRIAIARALLMDPRILILDDATSSVDTETEYLIQQALARLMRGRTTFLIAQRMLSVKDADVILVLDRGRIVERGAHEELIRAGGLYRQIYDMQLREQERFAAALHAMGSRRWPGFGKN
ncbi:MAG: ABC transporter ATP-binding protein [Ardenticatenia bacterium]|nr:ABC transporter ATP-binding protein [Ardenticatenia bacterium]